MFGVTGRCRLRRGWKEDACWRSHADTDSGCYSGSQPVANARPEPIADSDSSAVTIANADTIPVANSYAYSRHADWTGGFVGGREPRL